MATRKWVPIVVGVVIFVVLVGAGLVGGLVYVVSRQLHVQKMTAGSGQAEFERVAATMKGQKPFIELPVDGEGEGRVHREMETREPGSISTLHMRVWVSDEKKLVQLDLPYWLVRLGGNKPLKLHTTDRAFEGVDLTVTPEEIERRGPGLLLDFTTREGHRVLVWTE
jgi:hypothetical protein